MRPTMVKPWPLWRPSAPMRITEESSISSACLPMSSSFAPSRTRVDLQKPHTATVVEAPRKRMAAPHDGQAAAFMRRPFRSTRALPLAGASIRSTGVAQPRGEAVDGKVDAALHALLRVARAVAPQQLELQVVQRVEVGKAVADRARERGIRRQESVGAGDGEERRHGRLVLVLDAPEDRAGERDVG